MRRKLICFDCETDPFLEGRVPKPFIWGAFDGKKYFVFHDTEKFVEWISKINCVAFAHNGGKFDFMYLLRFVKRSSVTKIGGRIAQMNLGRARLRDSFSIVPLAMEKIVKQNFDYRKMEKNIRHLHMSEIEEYLESDCRNLFKIVAKYRAVAGKQITLASNAFADCKKIGVKIKKTNARFDNRMRKYFYGGRTEVFQPGTHKNGKVIDIVSSYPFAMKHLHPHGHERDVSYMETAEERLKEITDLEELGRVFITLKCYSKGAFPWRKKASKEFEDKTGAKESGPLEFPHKFDEFKVTGWEYIIAKKHNLIENEEILELIEFKKTIDFTPYIEKWFEYKASYDKEENPIEYQTGKLMQNAAYGKLAQNKEKYYDYMMHEPGTPVDYENGWELYSENYFGVEFHRRPSLYSMKKKFGDEWEKRPLFYNVASGASITGFARAHLLDAAHTIGIENVIYCDTDSLVTQDCDITKLGLGKELGQWDHEGDFEIGHFAGKKLYGIKFYETDKKGKQKIKLASKGCRIGYNEITDKIDKDLGLTRVERLLKGEKIKIINPAPTFSIASGVNFVHRELVATSREHERKMDYG